MVIYTPTKATKKCHPQKQNKDLLQLLSWTPSLIINNQEDKCETPFKGPCRTIQMSNKRTAMLQMVSAVGKDNTHYIKPYNRYFFSRRAHLYPHNMNK